VNHETEIAAIQAPSGARAFCRRFFRALNRCFMVPVFRLGLGPFVGNPFTGYIMVLTTVGRRSGRVRYTPLNYAILNDQVYCLAGWRRASHWYRNLRTHPGVACILPGGTLLGAAEAVTDPDEALGAVRQILKNAGFVGFALGFNPFTAPDDVLRRKIGEMAVIRIRVTGIERGASDPGGWFWLVSWALHAVAVRALIRRYRRKGGA
jgi:deazaflavin-dependent oxidoreductase (nitroreductase family)